MCTPTEVPSSKEQVIALLWNCISRGLDRQTKSPTTGQQDLGHLRIRESNAFNPNTHMMTTTP
ncbi:MAG TPA: hypothetical protein VE692_05310 [Nitrososphaera sp.]|nr:hypothetical protein [Nitrososphaera sp.]